MAKFRLTQLTLAVLLTLFACCSCDFNPQAVDVTDPLEDAIRADDADLVVKYLRSEPDRVDRKLGVSDYTPLYLSVLLRHDQVAFELLNLGADPFQDSPGVALGSTHTPIELALNQCRGDLARRMIESVGIDSLRPSDLDALVSAVKNSVRCSEAESVQLIEWIQSLF